MPRSPQDFTSSNSSSNKNNNDLQESSNDISRTANGRAFTASNNYQPSLPKQLLNYYPSVGENGPSRRPKDKHPHVGSPMDPTGGQQLLGGNGGQLLGGNGSQKQEPHHQYMGSKYAPNLPPRYSPPSGEGEQGEVPEDPPYYVQDLPRTRTL
ncbi:hypothetical protein FHG87_017575, partial [Trinorchestia longiramus]